MKAAFSSWNQRIAPVFDVARHIRLVEAEAGRVVQIDDRVLPDAPPGAQAARLTELGAQALVCGAISRPLELMVEAQGIQVIPFVAGDLDEVITAWLGERLAEDRFAMPGCCGRNRGVFRGGSSPRKEGNPMFGRNSGGSGRGGGQGRGRLGKGPGGGMGRGRCRQNKGAADVLQIEKPAAECVCPRCGHREPHELGSPCIRKQCPKCGTALTRE